ncbi:hypothetical protein ACGRSR_05035 [Vibrio owensii]|uniref:hypothetical protein n=1 Tax=Vibrio owensii TaxID=696485 RepID=UPI00374963D0
MFYNSKKLIDEKVLQQFYFECFMLADSASRKKLLPAKFVKYSSTEAVKGLNPEVKVGEKTTGGAHVTDFVLYPMPKTGLPKLNIELKWSVKDFEQQSERFPHYDGSVSQGFVVALKDKNDSPDFVENTSIPVVYLCPEEFKKWFTKKSYGIVSQALANKTGSKPSRLSGEKFWVVCIVGASEEHYLHHGKPKDIWAFRDNNNPKNIMNILDGDYVVFVRFDHCEPGRAVYPYSMKPNAKFEKSRGGFLSNDDISWSIDLIDIRKVNKGYHLNYTDKAPYHGFDEEWMEMDSRAPENKNYTQFITFKKPNGDHFEFNWGSPVGTVLDRKLFTDDRMEISDFVRAVRSSMNTRGDAVEISRQSFEFILHLVGEL